MFNLSGAPASFNAATITLNIQSGQSDSGKTTYVYQVASTWSESTLTYCPSGSTCTNCPPTWGSQIGSSYFTVASAVLQFNATAAFQAAIAADDTLLSFVLTRSGFPETPAIWIHFASHESGSGGYVTFY